MHDLKELISIRFGMNKVCLKIVHEEKTELQGLVCERSFGEFGSLVLCYSHVITAHDKMKKPIHVRFVVNKMFILDHRLAQLFMPSLFVIDRMLQTNATLKPSIKTSKLYMDLSTKPAQL